jgi:hypothetical protein
MDFASQHPAKLRFENTINKKNAQSGLVNYILFFEMDFASQHPAKLRFEKRKSPKIISSKLDYF